MKSVTFIGFLFLLNFKLSSSFKVKRLDHSTSTTEKDLHSPTPNFRGISQDDPALQRALQKVLSEMNSRLNKTMDNANDGDNNTVTKKLKLFFVTPSGISEEYEEIEGIDYSDSRYNIDSNQVNAFVTDRKERTSFKDHVNTSIAAKSVHTGEGIRLEAPSLKGLAATYFGGIKSSDPYETRGLEADHIYDRVGNETSEIFQNESQATKNDKVEMKVELTINLSENDHGRTSNSGDSAEVKNLSYGSGKAHLTGKTEDPDALGVHTSHQISEGDSPILNLATGNLNLNIKLMSHNHTDSNVKFENDNESKLDTPQKRHELGDHNPRNLSNTRRSETSNNIKLTPSHNIQQEKNNTEQYEKVNAQKFEVANHSNLSSREAKFSSAPLADKAEGVSDWIQTVGTTEKYLSLTEPSSSGVTEKSENQNFSKNSGLSDFLKKQIQNLSHHFSLEFGDNSAEGENRIVLLNRFLPQKGANPEEQRKIEELHEYLSQTDLFDKIGIRDIDSLTDFGIFIKVLSRLKRSEIVQGSSFFPIILYYLKLNNLSGHGTTSDGDSNSSEELWYSEPYLSDLEQFLFDYDRQDFIRNGVKAKLKFLGNEFEEDSDFDSGEY